MTVEDLLYGLKNGKIEAYDVLKYDKFSILPQNSSLYIESVIIGLPLLPLVFDGSHATWFIMDGAKRLSIIWNFAHNSTPLKRTYYSRLPEYTNFEDMSPFLRNRFLKAPILCYIINPGTPTDIIDDIQERVRIKL